MSFKTKSIIFTALIALSLIFDKTIVIFVSSHRVNALNSFILLFEESRIAYLFLGLFSLYLLQKKSGGWLPTMWSGIASATLTSDILKVIISRPRPYEVLLINPLSTNNTYSFPSGHTTLLFSIVALLKVTSLAQHKEFKFIKYPWFVYALLVAFNRIYLGVHYLSDVLAGAFLGYTIGYIWVTMRDNGMLENNLFKKWWWLLALLIFLARITLINLVYK
ncbi:MAG TPA: phosphatase PAP2 family protein [Actinobacteria bacterium]|nr:phosphatase PAP2 family protein [Actinomycetota bacterium]